MVHNRFFWVASGICLISLCAAPLFGQGTISLSSAVATGADIGVTESQDKSRSALWEAQRRQGR